MKFLSKYLSVFFLLNSTLFLGVRSEENQKKCECKGAKYWLCETSATKWVTGAVIGAVAVAAAPVVLAGAGFTASGITAGSIAATVQSAVYGGAATGVFATLQSAGAAGLGVASKIVVGSTASSVTSGILGYSCDCECD